MIKGVTIAAAWAAGLLAAGTAVARPWTARRPALEPRPAHQLRDPATWPAEPDAPAAVDPQKFRAAYAHLCSLPADAPATALSADVLSAATQAGVDPFLLAALASYGSNCKPKAKTRARAGVGLLAIDAEMYRAPGAPALPVDRAQLSRRQLQDPATNLAVGARLLKMWQDTHAEVDAAFGGAPHRTAVSHFVWGDEVRSSGHEDLVLTARRRMLAAYAGAVDSPRVTPLGIAVVSPLEAPPRVATSGPGEDRDGGARQHRGLDIVASLGEPVRAIAGGDVMFAGVNLIGHPRKGDIPPARSGRYANRRLGAGGIYVCLEHEPERHVVTCYMHLASYLVSEHDHVEAGQTIGYVGRSGVKVSPPHLHFEVRVDERFTNPVRTLGDMVIPPKATMTHQYMLKAKRAKRLRAELQSASTQRHG